MQPSSDLATYDEHEASRWARPFGLLLLSDPDTLDRVLVALELEDHHDDMLSWIAAARDRHPFPSIAHTATWSLAWAFDEQQRSPS